MSVTVHIPTILRSLTAGSADVVVTPQEATVQGTINALETAHPGIRARLLDESGAVRRFVNLYVGDEDIRSCGGLAAAVPAGGDISIIPAVAGG